MAFVSIVLGAEPFESVVQTLLVRATEIAAEELGVRQERILVTCTHAGVSYGGTRGPAAFIEVRSPVGLHANSNTRLARRLTELLESEVDVPAERVAVHLVDVAPGDWAHGGRMLD